MNYSAEQIANGIIKYADTEIINKLPTIGKWIVGASVEMLSVNATEIVNGLLESKLIEMLGVIDENGNIDITSIACNLTKSADKYGKAYIDIPLVGKVAFSSSDIELVKQYIEKG